MTAKRVLHVTQVYAGGISRAIRSLVELTPEVEHHLLWAGNEEPDDSLPFATVHSMPQSPRRMAASVRRVQEVAALVRPDIVHAHSSFGGVYARLARIEAPVFYEPHCYKFDDGQQPVVLRGIYRLVEKGLAKRSKATVVLSPHEERLAKSLDAEASTYLLPNVATIAPSLEHPATGFQLPRDVFMIGRLTGQKDPRYFAAVAEEVHAIDPSISFRWIGGIDGEDDGRGARMQQQLETAGVRVLGWLNGDALAAELARPGLYFHSAHYEGFPLSLLDAAAFEHPLAVRQIPTFDGLDLPDARTPAQAARLVLEILDGGPARARAVAAAEHLNMTMNRDAQRTALRQLYTSV
ncbi:glycosyltransferase [Microbacterium oryzae]|uniref:Glycosyltransferase n=1 Tax=Microbacterium oryzae TaxID=743009 RepID=A0A6I6E467_9MICO|nr:glycosyltransferase [Microbacterium oryzae]QGU27567.1 glycosyltransferase [Microbacterium oryzae]